MGMNSLIVFDIHCLEPPTSMEIASLNMDLKMCILCFKNFLRFNGKYKWYLKAIFSLHALITNSLKYAFT